MFRFEMLVNGSRVDVEAETLAEAVASVDYDAVRGDRVLCSVDLRPQTFLAW